MLENSLPSSPWCGTQYGSLISRLIYTRVDKESGFNVTFEFGRFFYAIYLDIIASRYQFRGLDFFSQTYRFFTSPEKGYGQFVKQEVPLIKIYHQIVWLQQRMEGPTSPIWNCALVEWVWLLSKTRIFKKQYDNSISLLTEVII